MRTIKIICYIELHESQRGIDPIIEKLQEGTFKITLLDSHEQPSYVEIQGFNYEDGKFVEDEPRLL